jgi:hypothetical protein
MSAPVDHRKLPRNKLTAGRFIGIDDDIMSSSAMRVSRRTHVPWQNVGSVIRHLSGRYWHSEIADKK